MRLLALVLALWLVAGSAARAELPSPFAWLRGGESSAATKTVKGTGKRATAVVTKMANAPNRLVTGTKNMLTPKKAAKKAKSGTVAVHKNDEPKSTEQGFLGRLFNPQPETSPATVNEWMALEKPQFGGARSIR